MIDYDAIRPGTVVRYYQPGLDQILGAWSGKPTRVGDPGGSEKTATVTEVNAPAGDCRYYYTEEGVMLRDSDLRGVVTP